MKQTWYLISDFPFGYIEAHLQVLDLLSDQDSKFFVREDVVSFDSLDEEGQQEELNDTFEIYKAHLFHDYNHCFYSKTEQDILSILADESIEIDKIDFQNNFYNNLKLIFEDLNPELQDKIKRCVKENVKQATAKPEKYYNFVERSLSYRYLSSDGILDTAGPFKWFEVKDREELKQALLEDRLYNVIITTDSVNFNNYSYYINFLEEEKMVLAIHDNKNKLPYSEMCQLLDTIGWNLEIKTVACNNIVT